jgi:hypothetical protein
MNIHFGQKLYGEIFYRQILDKFPSKSNSFRYLNPSMMEN